MWFIACRRHAAVVLFGVLVLPEPAASAWAARGMVASDHALASEAGVATLRQGGNAVDAAVATSFAVCVVSPSSCGIGGGGFMLIYRARDQRAHALDYREVAPAAATPDMFVREGQAIADLSRRGGLAVGVPGEVAGLTAALRRYGTLPLAVVMAPAIRYARDGFPIGVHLAREIAAQRDALRGVPGLAALLLRPDGTPLAEGDLLRQPELAQTLEQIATQGTAAFYRGPIAEAMVQSVQAAGGVLTAGDLAAYRPVWREALAIEFRGNRVYGMPPPSSAGVLLAVLEILEADDLSELGSGSATYLHLLAEAMQHGFADRARFYGDPSDMPVPIQRLLTAANTAALRQRISASRTAGRDDYGSAAPVPTAPRNDHGTSHLSVMDQFGNAVACTTTINTAFGAMVVANGTGIILNNEMDDFSAQPGAPNVYGLIGAEANAIAPGKRPLSSMCPVIVTRKGRPVLAAGGSGGPLIVSGTLQVVLNVLAFDQDASAAVAAPRVHDQWVPAVLMVEPGVPAATRATLARLGHSVREVPAMGAVQVVRRDHDVFEGAADPRKHGQAVGW